MPTPTPYSSPGLFSPDLLEFSQNPLEVVGQRRREASPVDVEVSDERDDAETNRLLLVVECDARDASDLVKDGSGLLGSPKMNLESSIWRSFKREVELE